MHPSRQELNSYVEGFLDAERHDSVATHLAECELCREFVADCELYRESVSAAEEIPPAAEKLAEQSYDRALAGRILDFEPLAIDGMRQPSLLAADGGEKETPTVRALATLYSENPEVVLRVMRDARADRDYLQLISDDSRLMSGVLIAIPKLDREYVTDSTGRAEIDRLPDEQMDQLRWNVKLPHSRLDLEPVVYDPDRTEYSHELLLETERKDRVRVVFEGKSEGKQIQLEILELDGRADYGPIKLTVSQGNTTSLLNARPQQAVCFPLVDPQAPIQIRLFG